MTHPDMQRYFMTIPETVLLILQAGAIGKGGEVFVLDMGDPVKVYDVACELIRLSGPEPDKDIPIIFTGIRPGEKLFEEVLNAEEGVEPTCHSKIFKARIKNSFDEELLKTRIETLAKISRAPNKSEIITAFQELIPTYGPNSSDPEMPKIAAD